MKYIVSVTGDVTSRRYRTLEVYADNIAEAKDKAENMFVAASAKSKRFVSVNGHVQVVSIKEAKK